MNPVTVTTSIERPREQVFDFLRSRGRTGVEVVESERPERIVGESVGAGGRRRTRGTHYLSDRPGGGTDVAFKLEWLAASRSERLLAPLARLVARRRSEEALRRLKEELEGLEKA